MNELENNLAWVLIGMISLIFLLVVAFLKKNSSGKMNSDGEINSIFNKENINK